MDVLFSLRVRPLIAAALLLTALLLAGWFVYIAAAPGPISVRDERDGLRVQFSADRSHVFLPGECVTAAWQVEGVQAVYLNDAGIDIGVVGSGTQTVCDSRGIVPKLRVVALDGSSAMYKLYVDILLLNPLSWAALALVIALIVLAARMGELGWLSRHIQRFAGASLLLGAVGISALLLYHFLNPAPMSIDISERGAHIFFSIDHATALRPQECLTVRWDTEAIRAATFNGEGVLGRGERELCGSEFANQHLRIRFLDDSEAQYNIKVNSMLYVETGLLLMLVSVMGAAGIDWLIKPAWRPLRRPAWNWSLNRHDARALVGLLVVGIVIFAPIIFLMSFVPVGRTDFPALVRIARELAQGNTPHGLYHYSHILLHVLVAVVNDVLPNFTYELAQAMIVLFFFIAALLLVYFMLRSAFGAPVRLRRALAYGGVALACMLVAPITVFTWAQDNVYIGYIVPNTYHNSTAAPLKPLALLLFLYALQVFRPSQNTRYSGLIMPAALTVISTMFKPNYTIALLPALALYGGVRLLLRKPRSIHWRLLIVGIGVPATIILIWQYYGVFGSGVGGSIAIWPLELYRNRIPEPFALWLILQFLMSVLFPLTVTLLYFRQTWHDLALRFAWLVFLIAAAYQYLLVQTGEVMSGNFLWGAQAALFILFIVVVIFFIRQSGIFSPDQPRRFDRRFWLCAAIFALHVVCGVFWYGTHLP